MIGLRAMARPYAKAIFNLAVSTQQLVVWSEWLALVAQVIKDQRLRKLLRDPMISDGYVMALLNSLFPHLSVLQKNFLQLLIHYKRLTLLPEVTEWYETFRAEHENVLIAQVKTTYALTYKQRLVLTQTLENYFSKKILLECQEDLSLLGGVVIRVGDQVFDGSGRKRLKDLGKQLRGIFE